MRKTLGERLAYEGYAIEATDDVSEASEMCRQMAFDVVLTDDSSNASPLGIPFIVLAGAGDNQIQRAVTAFRDGAMDFLQIPSDINRLYDTLRRYSEEEAPTQTPLPKQRLSAHAMGRARRTRASSVQPIIGSSNAIGNVRQVVARIAAFATRTLITGETGTGKEVFAQSIHQYSSRSDKTFVAINCSSFSRDLLESEMFGHKAGAFTGALKETKGLFEAADNGTIFLDEIGEMAFDLQAKLLRILETGEFLKIGDTKPIKVNVRVIAATNRDLAKEIADGHFREDLFYRLSVFQIHLPPLRERVDDIPLHVEAFVSALSSKMGKTIRTISPDYIRILKRYPWKGNVRELRNVVERSLIISDGDTLAADTLPLAMQTPQANTEGNYSGFDLSGVEKMHIQKVLKYTNGNKTETSRLLGIGLTTLYRKIEEYGL